MTSDDQQSTVRLLKDTCHGLAGEVVTVSASRGRELVARGDAWFVADEFFGAPVWQIS
ncbi:MAG TPA: hypothetical protein VJW94_14585 [Candidatus Acidoferrum sp.]|nr:hypothetical protein [Candidatus Acidoferrum sp.]